MLSLSLTFVFLLFIGTHGAPQDTNLGRPLSTENSFSLGKLRVSKDGQAEELIPVAETEKPILTSGTTGGGVQQLSSPCTGSRPMTKLAHPTEKTKYIQCRDQFHYEVFFCPNHGEFDEMARTCVVVSQGPNICEEEKPCLNGGECVMANSTFKCNCGKDWSGERCETPNHICATKPCGANAECRPFKASDFKQDYICLCKGRREYGPNCLETLPNPCAQDSDQFFPFGFSPRIYIQCDGDSIFFQPCGPSLYWNQDEKFCDRKRPTNVEKKTNGRRFFTKTEVSGAESKKESFSSSSNVESSSSFTKTIIDDGNTFDKTRIQIESASPSSSFVPTLVSGQTTDLGGAAFAVNSQSGSSEIVGQGGFNKVESFISTDSSKIRVKEPQFIRTETVPFEITKRPGFSSNSATVIRQELRPVDKVSINRIELPSVEQSFGSVSGFGERKSGSESSTFQQSGIQGMTGSSSFSSSGMRGQGSRQDMFRTGGSVRIQTSPTFAENVEISRSPLMNNQETRITEFKVNRPVETTFVAGFAPSVKERETFVRKEQTQSNKFTSSSSNMGQMSGETDFRTFGTRAFFDTTSDTTTPQPETTTVFNRFSLENTFGSNIPSSSQQRAPMVMNTIQERFIEVPQNLDEEQRFTTTTTIAPVDMNNVQFQTFSQQGSTQTQRFPTQQSFTNFARSTGTPLTWEEIIRINKLGKTSTTTAPTPVPIAITAEDTQVNNDDHEETVGNQDFSQRVPSGSSMMMSQRIQPSQSNFVDTTTVQSTVFRQPGLLNSNFRDQDTVKTNDLTFQQRPSQQFSMGSSQFSEMQNRKPVEETRFFNQMRNQQRTPISESMNMQATENSFSNDQRSNNGQFVNSGIDTTTIVNNMFQGNQQMMDSQSSSIRMQETRPISNQLEGQNSFDRNRILDSSRTIPFGQTRRRF